MVRSPKRILFQGLGGAGQRHLRIFRELLPHADMVAWRHARKTPVLNADFSVDEDATLEGRYGIELLQSMEQAWERSPDLVVIATPSIFHADASVEAAKHGADIFVEKPGAIDRNQYQALESAVRENGVDYFVSFQRRFHPLVQRMRSIVQSGELGSIMSVRVNVTSYVPDWHPYEDFRDLYACREDLGGGVLRTESHEIDLVLWLFGPPDRICSISGRRGPHSIDVEDSAELLFDYRDFAVQISLCFMQRHQERSFIINGQDGWLECDLLGQRLCWTRSDEEVKVSGISIDMEQMFTAQARFFLEHFEKGDLTYLKTAGHLADVIDTAKSSVGLYGIDLGT